MILRAIVIIVLGLSAAPALAQANIGQVASIERDVTGAFGGRTAPLKANDSVVQNETVTTGVEALARLAFHDQTTLAIGPQASLKLDRFVYNPDATGSAITANLARGAFRFISGSTPSESIALRTPLATIGVRGTVIDVLVRAGRVIVILRQGAAFACQGARCVNLTQADTGLIITPGNIAGPTAQASAEFDFDRITRFRFPLYQHPAVGQPRGENAGGTSSPGSNSSSSSRQ